MKKYIGLLIGIIPLLAAGQLVMNNSFYMVINGGTMAKPTTIVLTNPAPAGITNNGTGWIVSENEFNQVQWNIGTNAGNYIVPFGYATTDYLPVTCDITGAGTGAGKIKFSTYHGSTWDNTAYKPSDVTTMTEDNFADYSRNMTDRFWEVDANAGYITKPAVTLKFTYIRTGVANEIAAPNTITESQLVAQRFNPTLNKWDDFIGTTGTDVTAGNIGTVSSGSVTSVNLYRSWTLAKDTAGLGVNNVITENGTIATWPNPATKNINIRFSDMREGEIAMGIVDVTGRELITKNFQVSSGLIFPVDVSALPAGIYFIRLYRSNCSITSKFVKQ